MREMDTPLTVVGWANTADQAHAAARQAAAHANSAAELADFLDMLGVLDEDVTL